MIKGHAEGNNGHHKKMKMAKPTEEGGGRKGDRAKGIPKPKGQKYAKTNEQVLLEKRKEKKTGGGLITGGCAFIPR